MSALAHGWQHTLGVAEIEAERLLRAQSQLVPRVEDGGGMPQAAPIAVKGTVTPFRRALRYLGVTSGCPWSHALRLRAGPIVPTYLTARVLQRTCGALRRGRHLVPEGPHAN